MYLWYLVVQLSLSRFWYPVVQLSLSRFWYLAALAELSFLVSCGTSLAFVLEPGRTSKALVLVLRLFSGSVICFKFKSAVYSVKILLFTPTKDIKSRF